MKKESKIKSCIEWIVMFILIFGTFAAINQLGLTKGLKPETTIGKYIMVIGIFMMSFVVLAVHELGHLLTGLMVGFRFELFVVGPLGIKREGDRIKLYLNKNLGYYGGIAATTPSDNHPDNAKKFAKVILAGPISSVLFAILLLIIVFFIGKPLGIIFYTGAITSIAIFFATTIPSSTGIFFTDRKRYQRLTTPGKDQDVELAILRILGIYSKDNSYKNIDRTDIQILVDDTVPFIKFYGVFNLMCFQLEHNRVIDESVLEEYKKVSKHISKKLVKAFNNEIEKYKVKTILPAEPKIV